MFNILYINNLNFLKYSVTELQNFRQIILTALEVLREEKPKKCYFFTIS